MIPKVIHYCWFGGNELPKEVEKCIASWKKMCPDYKIVRWDEKNFDVFCNNYVKEAYEARKWAFVSDFARLKIVYDVGGIYLDTDVELIKSLDSVINDSFFFATEKDTNEYSGIQICRVATGLGFGAEIHNEVVKSMIDEYDGIHFRLEDGNFDFTPCPVRNARSLYRFGYEENNEMQKFAGGTIYPAEYFCPKEFSGFVTNFSENTISIHHYSSSWKSKKKIFVEKTKNIIKKILFKLNKKKTILKK